MIETPGLDQIIYQYNINFGNSSNLFLIILVIYF